MTLAGVPAPDSGGGGGGNANLKADVGPWHEAGNTAGELRRAGDWRRAPRALQISDVESEPTGHSRHEPHTDCGGRASPQS